MRSTTGVGIADEPRFAITAFLVVGDVTVGVDPARTGLAQNRSDYRYGTCTVRVPDGSLRAVAGRLSASVAFRTLATRIRVARVSSFDTTTNSVGAFKVSWQTGAFRKAVVEYGALSVGSAR